MLFKFDQKILKDRIIIQLLDLSKFGHLVANILSIILDIMNHDGFLTLDYFNNTIRPTLT